MGSKREEVREELPEEMRPYFDRLVEEYKFQSLKHLGRVFVSYAILAALIKDGWRPTD